MHNIESQLQMLKSRASVLDASVKTMQKMLSSDPRRLAKMLPRYIKRPKSDLQESHRNPTARYRLNAFDGAMDAQDIVLAVKHGVLVRPELYDTARDEAFFLFIDESRELAGLTEVLGWLDHLETAVSQVESDVSAVLNKLVQMGVSALDECDCEADTAETIDEYPALAWLHAHHGVYNLAVWEIISSRDILIQSLQQAIEQDIAGPTTRYARFAYGKLIERRYARALLDKFVQQKPSPAWVGTIVEGYLASA